MNDLRLKARSQLRPTGTGGHSSLLSAANIYVLAGMSDTDILADIQQHMPKGNRRVPDSEINAAIRRARMDTSPRAGNGPSRGFSPSPYAQARRESGSTLDGKGFLAATLRQSREKWGEYGEAELWELSPVRINWEPAEDARNLLEILYAPDDVLFIGDRFDRGVKTVREWLADPNLTKHPHIIPNPLTGQQGSTKDGKSSLRADDCVKDFRFAVIEFDDMPREDQIGFWLSIHLPVVALIDSGGKSIHGWIRTDAPDRAAWERYVEGKIFPMLTEIGCDPSCRNEARLSRLPGHFREEKKRIQRILYLDPAGGGIWKR